MNIVERTNQRSMSTSLSLFENEGSVDKILDHRADKGVIKRWSQERVKRPTVC